MRKCLYVNIFVIMVLVLSACGNSVTPTFSDGDLVGYWARPSTLTNGEDWYRYDANGAGVCWDTGDDVTEAEAQPFTWSLENDKLVLIHQGEMGEVVPKSYTVTKLSSTVLSYRDNYGNSYSFSRQR